MRETFAQWDTELTATAEDKDPKALWFVAPWAMLLGWLAVIARAPSRWSFIGVTTSKQYRGMVSDMLRLVGPWVLTKTRRQCHVPQEHPLRLPYDKTQMLQCI